MLDALGVGLGLAGQRRQLLSEVSGRGLVEAMVDLAGVEQPIAFAPANIDASQSLPSRAKPAIASVSRWPQVGAVGDFRDHSLTAELGSMGEQLGPVDLETLAELEVGAGDEFLQHSLACGERQLPQIAAVEVEQIEGHQHDLGRVPRSSFCSTEKSRRRPPAPQSRRR